MNDLKLDTKGTFSPELHNYDMQITDGDFVIDESTRQHQELLLLTHPGHWRQKPAVGVGLLSFINNEDPTDAMRAIRQQFTRDGMHIKKLQPDGETLLKVTAEYK